MNMTYKDFNWHPYKRLWLDENYEVWPTQSRSDTVGYVREDIVDGLVEALNECLKVEGYKNAREMIEAALKSVGGWSDG